jgi:pyridinium-3,5-biscarboxylic acid mononucleotide sulfurtransferase
MRLSGPSTYATRPIRCLHCKDELLTRISDEVVERHGLAAVGYGENADDARRPDRPGARAAVNHAVLRPLADAGRGKAAAPCLASRISHFEPVTPQKLAQIEVAEASVRALGVAELRVRHHGAVARLELPPADIARAAASPLRQAIDDAVRGAGFRSVTLDLAGLQPGAFTLALIDKED